MTLRQLQRASLANADRAQQRAALAAWDLAVAAWRLPPLQRWRIAVPYNDLSPLGLHVPADIAQGGAL